MKLFSPPGFEPQTMDTTLGQMVYYTPSDLPWSHWQPKGEQDERPLLVFLHSLGGGSSAYEWSKVYPAFAADYRVIAPDLIGWGASAHPQRDYSADDYVALMTELLEYLGCPAMLVATSLTAAFSIRVAIAHPHLVQSLFLVCPSGYDDFGRSYRTGLSAQLAGTPGLDQIIYALGAANEIAVRNFLEQFLFAQPNRITDEMVAAYTASAQQPNAEYAALAALKGALFFDLTRYLDQLTIPTAFIWGQASKFNSPEFGQRLAALNPQAVKWFETIANTGVLPHLECPAVVAGILRAWLHRRVARSGQ
ncbi:MAG: alpha/beta hydrolase [Cyanothece sp. SIO2G6]|nr:alpha/beta hydrolase [Cyanothece sp. SIO2G6]